MTPGPRSRLRSWLPAAGPVLVALVLGLSACGQPAGNDTDPLPPSRPASR